MQKIKNKLVQLLFWAYFKLRIHKTWSSLYRFLYERKYKDAPVDPLDIKAPFHDLAKRLGTMKWKADGLKELWDAVSYPGAIQAKLNHDRPLKEKRHGPSSALYTQAQIFVGDCDEFAQYIMACLNSHPVKIVFTGKNQALYMVSEARMMTVLYQDENGVIGAHNVALVTAITRGSADKAPDRFFFHMDYKMPPEVLGAEHLWPEEEGVAWSVKDQYAGSAGRLLGYAITDKNLSVVAVKTYGFYI